MNSPLPGESGCELMERLAEDQRKRIKKTEKQAADLAHRIAVLEAQSPPDAQQIKALKQTLGVVETMLEEERRALADLESVISENC